MSHLQTPLAKVRGTGTAKDGTGHFFAQRLTAIALIPLSLWFCISIAALPEANYATVVAWLQSPFNSVMLGLSLFAGFYHLQLGLQVIIEDYIGNKDIRLFSIIAVKLFSVFFAALAIFSIIKVSVGG